MLTRGIIIVLILILSKYAWSRSIEFLQNKMIYQPSFEINSTPDLFGIPYYTIKPGNNITAWLTAFPVNEKSKNKPKLIIYCHGNGGNIQNTLGFINIIKSQEPTKQVLVFDYNGYGESDPNVKISEETLVKNTRTVIDYALMYLGYTPSDIIIYGHSLGGAVAIQAIAEHSNGPHFASLIVEGTFSSLLDRAKDSCSLLGWPCFSLTEQYKSIDYIKYIHCPLIIVHSLRDEIILYKHAEKLYATAHEENKNVKFITLQGGSHNSPIYSSEYFQMLNAI